ncbi:MAG: tRNA (mo5U34)-methyltransferase [Acidimicrobiaceae bacterium]|nr:tRNA (mo5U34)-methyltransferase [Acidimicrobiaceae bacterium]
MVERSVQFRGFRLSAEVPDRVGQLMRRVIGGARRPPLAQPQVIVRGDSRLLVRDPPPTTFVRHDPEIGLGFITDRIAHRARAAAQAAGRPKTPTSATDTDEAGALARQVAAQPWYHTIELPYGIETSGYYDHRPLVPIYGIPADLTGKRVLDVATADGFWAFEFERRGGEVTALDIETTADVDLPPRVQQLATQRGYADLLGDGFELAHRSLGSKVKRVVGTVYDLDPDRLGRFDLVHTGDLLLHLRDPIRALQKLRTVTEGEFLLSDVFDSTIGWPQRIESGVSHYLGGSIMAGWWTPALGTLVQMVIDAGFSDVEVLTVYSLIPRGMRDGPWRAVLRARP